MLIESGQISDIDDNVAVAPLLRAGRHQIVSPIHKLVISYILLIPLVFFAAGGALSFQHGERNTAVGHRLGAAAETDNYGSRNLELIFIYGIVLFAIAPRVPAVIALAKKNTLLTCLAVMLPLSALWSQVPRQTLRNGFYAVVDIAFVFFLMRRFSRHQLMRLMVMLAAAVFLLSAFFALLTPGIGLDQMEGRSAWQGIFIGKNNCAMGLNFLLMPVLYVRLSSGWKRAARVALIAGMVGSIVMTQSRTGWVLCCVNLGLWAAFSFLVRLPKKEALLLAAAGCVGATALVSLIVGQFSAFTELIGKDATLTGRTEIWAPLMLSLLKRPLLGYGYSTFWTGIDGESGLVALKVGWVASYAHNGYLEVALQLGLVGLGLVVLSLAGGLRNVMRCIQPHCAEYIGWFTATLLLTILYNVDESTFLAAHQLVWMLYLVALVGLAEAVVDQRSKDRLASNIPAFGGLPVGTAMEAQ
jgi:O-antigen ligase